MSSSQPVIMMCQPKYFDVSYSINPWMAPDEWAENGAALGQQSSDGWQKLTEKLQELGARLIFQKPQPGLPDLVFTANAAVVMDRKALVAHYRHPERQGEEPHDLAFFQDLQAKGELDRVQMTPDGVLLEGAGDCVWDGRRRQFWVGYGQRSDEAATTVVRAFFGLDAVGLQLVDPRYYHMDTALVPLTGGEIMYYPGAFSSEGQAVIRDRAGAENLIAVPQEDAERLGVNAVNIGQDIVLAKASDRFRGMLEERGYTLHQLPIDTFSKSGGSAFCLTLRLDRVSG